MNVTVSTKERAWQLADKLFPTDYMKDEHDSLRAGYPVFNTTSEDDRYTGFHISDLNTALELNMGAETIRINIADQEAEIKNNFDKLLQYVSDKRKSAELHERQKYNYYCDRQAGCWNWTKEQDEAYQKEWDDIIIQMHALKDLENAMNLARNILHFKLQQRSESSRTRSTTMKNHHTAIRKCSSCHSMWTQCFSY